MKLTSAQVERTLSLFEAEPIPDDHPALSQLSRTFGEHTFFLDPAGLHIVTPVQSDSGTKTGQIVKLASWSDPDRTSLAAHAPEPTNVIVLLAA